MKSSEPIFQVLDKLIDVNGMKMRDDKEFYSFLQRLDDDLDVNVLRSVAKKEDNDETQKSTNSIYRVLISLAVLFKNKYHFER